MKHRRKGQGRFRPGRWSGPSASGDRPGFYRARNGKILGVCQGLADYFGFSVTWIRVFAVFLLLTTGFWPVLGIYFLAALVMRLKPAIPFSSDADREFYDSYSASRSMGLARLKRKFETIERRIRRMEHTVTSRDFDWEQRFEK